MAWFRRARHPDPSPAEPAAEERSTINLSQYAHLWTAYSGVYSPMAVGPDQALTWAACWACIDVLATSVSITPLDVVRYNGTARTPVSAPPLISSPSMIVDQDVWLYQLVESMASDGNGWGMVTAVDAMSRPTTIELLSGSSVTQRKLVDGVPQAVVDNSVHRVYPYGDLFHIPGKMVRAGSPFGENVLLKAQATIGAALAAREYATRTFGDGGVPVGRWKSDKELNATQAQAIKAVLRQVQSGSREPIVTGTGLEWEALSVDMDQTQFLDVMKFAIEEACRFFRVPPQMVYAATSGQSVTYSNATQADLSFLKYSVDGYMVRIERRLSQLITRPQVVKFNRSAFLRMDAETRAKIHDARLKNKTITVNEVRSDEDQAPFDGDIYNEPGIPGSVDPAPVGGTDGTTV